MIPGGTDPATRTGLPRYGTVLVVDDEPLVRRVACKVLEDVFTEVLEASSAQEALDVAAAHPRDITLLLTDVVMPGMGGRALSERMRTRHPRTLVLFMSAYTDDEVVLEGIRRANLEFIPKPFSVDGLRDKVLEVLGKRASA